jgi:hypothetical protein
VVAAALCQARNIVVDLLVRLGTLSFDQWFPIAEGQIWCPKTNRPIDPAHTPLANKAGSMGEFLKAAQHFFHRFEGRKIGVQLSGGFDSSLIIGLLRYFKIPHSLVGLKSERYEFRTERHIQSLLASQNGDVILIDEACCLPCSRLNEIPPHQIPDLLSLDCIQDIDMAVACQNLGIQVLLSGGGGDNLMAQPVPTEPAFSEWRPQTFTDPFPVDIVYKPRGIEFLSFFSDRKIVDAFYCLRRGQKEDCAKRWARNFFRDFVPRELVDYTYCADFWGRSIDGMIASLDHVRELHKESLHLTGNAYFNEENLDGLIKDDLYRPRKDLYQRLESRISSAVWVVSLTRLFEIGDFTEQIQSDQATHPAERANQDLRG